MVRYRKRKEEYVPNKNYVTNRRKQAKILKKLKALLEMVHDRATYEIKEYSSDDNETKRENEKWREETPHIIECAK